MSRLTRHIYLIALWSHRLWAAESMAGKTVVHWESIPGCPSESEVIEKVQERLGQPLTAAREQSLRLHAKIYRNEGGEFEVLLTTESMSGTGQRRLSNEHCAALAEATSLVMAIAIDPKRVQEREAETRARLAQSTTSEILDESPHLTRFATKRPSIWNMQPRAGRVRLSGTVRWAQPDIAFAGARQWFIDAKGLVGKGVLPQIDLGTMVTASYLLRDGFALRIGGGVFAPQTIGVPSSSGSMTLTAGFLDSTLCFVPAGRRWRMLSCAGGELGWLWAVGEGMDNAHGENAPTGSLVAGSEFQYRVGAGIGLAGSVTASLGLRRPRFGARKDGAPEEAFQSELVAIRLGFGLYWDAP